MSTRVLGEAYPGGGFILSGKSFDTGGLVKIYNFITGTCINFLTVWMKIVKFKNFIAPRKYGKIVPGYFLF